jgi:hypothetical protein
MIVCWSENEGMNECEKECELNPAQSLGDAESVPACAKECSNERLVEWKGRGNGTKRSPRSLCAKRESDGERSLPGVAWTGSMA